MHPQTPTTLALLLACTLLLAGCTSPSFVDNGTADEGTNTDPGSNEDEQTHSAPDAGQSGSTPPSEPTSPDTETDSKSGRQTGPRDPHGDVQRTEGETTARPGDDGGYVAEKRIVLKNGVGDALLAEILLTVDFANVTVVGANVGSYTYTFDLDVEASTEAQARNGMDRVTVIHDDTLADETLSLGTYVRHAPANGLPVGSGLEPSEDLSYDLRIEVPNHLLYTLALNADMSAFASGPLAWSELEISGDYSAILFADAIGLEDLDVAMDFGELALRTAPAGGTWSIAADYTSINIQAHGDAAYDVLADGDYSSLQVHLKNSEDVNESNSGIHKRTRGYEDHPAQVDAVFYLDFGSLAMNG